MITTDNQSCLRPDNDTAFNPGQVYDRAWVFQAVQFAAWSPAEVEVLNENFMSNLINQVENMSAGDSKHGGSLKDRSVKASLPESYADGLNAVA